MNYYKIINTNGVNLGKHCMTKIISEVELVKIENYYFLDIEFIKLDANVLELYTKLKL